MKLFLVFGALVLLPAFQDPPAKPDFGAELKALQAEYAAAEKEYYRPLREAKTAEERAKAKPDPAKHPSTAFIAKYRDLAKRAKGNPAASGALLEALKLEYRQAEQEYYRPYQEAKTDEERRKIKLDPDKNPATGFLEKYRELAGEAKGTEAGAGALLEVMQLAQRVNRGNEAREAVEILVDSYIESPVMERLATSLRYANFMPEEDRGTTLETIQQKSPHKNAKAAATFILAVSSMRTNAEKSRTSFAMLKKEFGDSPYAQKADAFLFELENLQIGKVAPDFEATDEKGKKYKLSDYRGKVVVLDFWGFW